MSFRLLILLWMTTMNFLNADQADLNLSHYPQELSFEEAKLAITSNIQNRGDLPYVTMERQLELVQQLCEFDLGRFLIERKGLNGFWTHYIISHPTKGRTTGLNQYNMPFPPLEDFFLNKAPTCLATQSRFAIFKSLTQEYLQEGGSYASIPCGLMGDLIELDYTKFSEIHLYGIDLDPESLIEAKAYAEKRGIAKNCTFLKQNAWDLNIGQKLDLIVSNGLNIYEPDEEKVIELYQGFYNCLKPGGVLITSFLTQPSIPGKQSGWLLENVNIQDAMLQKIIFADILSVKWQTYRTEDAIKLELKRAGFSDIEFFYDVAHIFPTVVAKKK